MATEFVQKLFGLDGQIAVVIGGTGVLGGALCEGLAQAGATREDSPCSVFNEFQNPLKRYPRSSAITIEAVSAQTKCRESLIFLCYKF